MKERAINVLASVLDQWIHRLYFGKIKIGCKAKNSTIFIRNVDIIKERKNYRNPSQSTLY